MIVRESSLKTDQRDYQDSPDILLCAPRKASRVNQPYCHVTAPILCISVILGTRADMLRSI